MYVFSEIVDERYAGGFRSTLSWTTTTDGEFVADCMLKLDGIDLVHETMELSYRTIIGE